MTTRTTIAEYRENKHRGIQRARLGLWLLNALVIGGLIALLSVTHVINQQIDTFQAQGNLSTATANIVILDKLLPYHLGYILGTQILLACSIAVELWTRLSGWRSRQPQLP